MRILWVKAGKLLPVNTGGRIRSYNLLRQLDRRNDLTLLTYYDDGRDDEHDANLSRQFRCADTIHVARAKSTALDYLGRVAHSAPYAVTKFTAPDVKRRVSTWLKAARFDVAVCDFLSASLNFPNHRTTPV